MFDRSMTGNAQYIIKEHLRKQGRKNLVAVDGTLGNGHDLCFLSSLEEVNAVIGFDIQEEAISECQSKMKTCTKLVRLLKVSHHQMDEYIEKLDIAMFNLGYLPSGNKEIVTCRETSLIALQKAIYLLADGGIITVMTYPGHEEGYNEHQAIEDYLKRLYEPDLTIFNLSLKNTKKLCPSLYVIIKKG